jgi:glycolate oxidase iron-sulfur subunit
LLGRRKAAHAVGTGAAVIATGNIGCITQLARYASVPVVHIVQLLDWVMGGSVPEPLRDLPLPPPRDAPGAASLTTGDGHAIW